MSFSKKAVQAFFFEAMRHGWASGIKGSEVTGMRNHRRVEFPDSKGNFLLEERYEVSTDLQSRLQLRLSGSIIIFHHEVEIWSMTYKGKHKKDALPHLRLALMENYNNEVFIGGRGPTEFPDPKKRVTGELAYENSVHLANDFSLFEGKEVVYTVPPVGSSISYNLGMYRYSGGFIVPRLK